MKTLFIFFLSFFTFISYGQKGEDWTPSPETYFTKTKIECYSCDIQKQIKCNGCDIESELFNGLIISNTYKDIALYHPIKITTRGNLIKFKDAFGKSCTVNLRKTEFQTMNSFYDYIQQCSCNSTDPTVLQTLTNLQNQINNNSLPEGGTFNQSLRVTDSGEYFWDKDCDKQIIEIPNNIFFDKTNPKISEVSDWVSNNLDSCQKINSQLFMVEEYQLTQNSNVNKPFNLTPNGALVQNTGVNSWTPDAFVDSILIDGTSYNIGIPLTDNTGALITPYSDVANSIKTLLQNASNNEGLNINWNVSIFSNGSTSDFQLEIQGQKFNTPILNDSTSFILYTTNFSNSIYSDTSLVSVETVAISYGTTAEEPDYIWDIVNGDIDEIFRRTNQGDVLYVSGDIDNSRSFYAQRGNPNRPFRDPWQARDESRPGDLIVILKGEYTWGSIGSGAYKESDGLDQSEISLVRENLNYFAYPGVTFQAISIQNNPIFKNDLGHKFSFKGHADFIIPSNNVGLIVVDGDNAQMEIEINKLVNGGSQWTRCITVWKNNVVLNFKARRVESYLARFFRMEDVSNCYINIEVDEYFSPQSDADYQLRNLNNCSVNITFNSSDIGVRFQNTFLGDIDSSRININFKNAIWRDFNGSAVRYDAVESSFNNSILHINYGKSYFYSSKPLATIVSKDIINSEIKLSGDIIDTSTGPIISCSGSRTTTAGSVYLDFNIFNKNPKSEGVIRNTSSGKLIISGNYVSLSDTPLIKTDSNLSLSNAAFINQSGGSSAIITRVSGTGNLDLICNNVRSNILTLDPNFSELGSSILRNINFR